MNDKGNLSLRTKRLYLRRFTAADAPLLFELDSDPEVMRHISKGEPTPLEEIEKKILPSWLRMYEQSDHFDIWATHETATDRFIGWFHLRPDRDAPDDQELGYRLRRDAWGRGYATECSRALIEKAFQEWWTERIVARALVGNAASRRVMEKCGLRFEEFFTYPLALIPGWTEEERAAVKYGLRRL